MAGKITIDYVSTQAQAGFSCPFCGEQQVSDFRTRIVGGRFEPDPRELVRRHLTGSDPCRDPRSADYKHRDIEEDYRIVVRMDGLWVAETRRQRQGGEVAGGTRAT